VHRRRLYHLRRSPAVIDTTVLVEEGEILNTMRLVLNERGWLIEGAAAVALAAFLKTSAPYAGKTVVILSAAATSPSGQREL